MPVSMMISLGACVFMIVSVFLYPLRRIWLLRTLGSREYLFRGKFRFQFIGVLIASPVLVIGASVRGVDLPVLVMVSVVSVVLFILSYRDLLHIGLGGVYDKGLVWNGRSVLYANIAETDRPDPYTLVIKTRRGCGRMMISGSVDFIDIVSSHIEKTRSPLQ